MNELDFLDRLRGIAQQGLTYATDPHDVARYEALLRLSAEGYEAISGLPADDVAERLRREIGGYVTPKVGVDGAVFNGDGALLLIRRSDSGLWALPGGWAELGETPEQSVIRELREETGITVKAGELIAVSTMLPRSDHPHTSVHLLYECVVLDGQPHATPEAADIGFFDRAASLDWHGDHGAWVTKAVAWRTARKR